MLRIYFSMLAFILIYQTSICQERVSRDKSQSPKEIEYSKIRSAFENNQHEVVISFFDTATVGSPLGYGLSLFKMAFESSRKLSSSKGDFYDLKAEEILKLSESWFGKPLLDELWSTISIDSIHHLGLAAVVPQFPGGNNALGNFIKKHLKYPEEARKKEVEGKVFVSFMVNKDGSLSAINVMRGLSLDCDKEAIRLISIFPKFRPGIGMDGNVKYCRMVLPVLFDLND